VEYGQKGVRNSFFAWKVQGYSAKAQIYYASAMRGLVGKDGVSICSSHRDTFGLSGNREDARFIDGERKSGPRSLQRRDRKC
jgi:hypothetical protein